MKWISDPFLVFFIEALSFGVENVRRNCRYNGTILWKWVTIKVAWKFIRFFSAIFYQPLQNILMHHNEVLFFSPEQEGRGMWIRIIYYSSVFYIQN